MSLYFDDQHVQYYLLYGEGWGLYTEFLADYHPIHYLMLIEDDVQEQLHEQ